ncbi:12509_t:CDS:2 [Acaulospora morrowiae]|uniref:Carbonic anhydrase n=1 Tax=Acaulospora morrowiae TaxID=94023 RepID=A0A9N9ALS8_9GLOM|nr:12509_t:CDS:2 [Acaulospora morrowiae]
MRVRLVNWLKNAKQNKWPSHNLAENTMNHSKQHENRSSSFQSFQSSLDYTIPQPRPSYASYSRRSLSTKKENDNPYEIRTYLPDLLRSFGKFEHGLKDVLDNNKRWADNSQLKEMKFFDKLENEPKLYWIGCSDSRVPPEIISQLGFGQLFVHRNIANQFDTNDTNSMSVLEFTVNHLKVEHIVVCGHTKCAGVKNACNNHLEKNLIAWLSDIRKIKDVHPELFPDQETMSHMSNDELDRIHKTLVGVNVKNQVKKISESEVVKKAWEDEERKLAIHGWVFNMENGHLEDLGVTVGRQ